MWPKKSRQGFFAAKNRKHLLKLKYPEQVAEPESPIIVRIFLFDAVSFKKRYLPTAPSQNKSPAISGIIAGHQIMKSQINR